MTSILKVSEIQDPTNGNSALTIDSAGHVLTPARPAFSILLSTPTGTSEDYTTLDDCPFDTIEFNIGNCVAISSGVATFTAPVDGIYHFNFTVSISGATSAAHVSSYLFVDNTGNPISKDHNWRNIEDPQGGQYVTPTSNALIQLNANQTVNPKLEITGDTTIQVRRATRFSGFLVG